VEPTLLQLLPCPDIKSSQARPQSAGPDAPSAPSTPLGERTDRTQSAAKLVEEVVQSVKSVVDKGLTWAENKVDEMSSHEEHENVGPYTSPATCVPSDLDVIASGILPAVMQFDSNDEEAEMEGEEAEEKNRDNDKEENRKDGSAESKL
jgi:hypothetical protein